MKMWLLNLLIAFDQGLNALLCGDAQDALRQFPDVYAGNI